jgi:hypothetical protein
MLHVDAHQWHRDWANLTRGKYERMTADERGSARGTGWQPGSKRSLRLFWRPKTLRQRCGVVGDSV